MILHLLDILTIVFALIAAVLWFWSAAIKTPGNFSVKPDQPIVGVIAYNPPNPDEDNLGKTIIGKSFSYELKSLAAALKRQSKFSGYAAAFAGLSALAQFLSMVIKQYILTNGAI